MERRALAGDVGQHGVVLDDLAPAQGGQGVDGGLQVRLLLEPHLAGHHPFRLGHQPQAELGHHAEVRLQEQPVQRRAEAALEQLPALAAGQGAHSGAHHLARGQHHLHPADLGGVVAIGRVADPALQGVAHDAAPPQRRGRDPKLQPPRPDVLVEVEERHPRFDQGVGVLLVDLDDPVHPAEVEHHRAPHPGRAAAVAEVLADGDRPQRDAVLAGDPHRRLHLFDAARPDRPGADEVLATPERIGVGIGGKIGVRAEHGILAERRGEGLQRLAQPAGRHAGWKCAVHSRAS